ncbi:Aste57867_22784 [Aphanomyces stellatus]|uniref:Aste57867_22784 protein n=1 Tax=Aphanomyces stellatus TaxID=120398 RepID=A0A485LL46_9STRA|nr:hypothetical protein As57867_022714 [Aphanomyces stellatus]VFT99437.1 Aste57867_22784 [Aphanomyces stellatus]
MPAVLAVAPIAQAKRLHSATSIQVRSALRQPTQCVALVKHSISGLYYATVSAIYVFSLPQDLRALQAYAPLPVSIINAVFALLHLYGFVDTCIPRLRRRLALPSSNVLLPKLPLAVQLSFFHFVDVSCQSYQAYRMSFYLVNRTASFGFTALVALNCLVTPWFLLIQHKVARKALVLLASSLIGFVVSTIFPIFVFLIPAAHFNFINRSLRNSPTFLTGGILASRYAIVSSPLDLATKTVLQASSLFALRNLVHFVGVLDSPSMSDVPSSVSLQSLVSPATLSHGRRKRPILTYVAFNLVWGTTLLVISVVSNFHRNACPDTCLLEIAPWFDMSCQCAAFELNCAMRNISGDTIESQLGSLQLGRLLVYMDIRRCSIPNGISTDTLAPFQQLLGLHIAFSNMTQWPREGAGLPESLTTIQIRYSNLTSVPDVLASVSPNLVYMRIESAPIASIPDSIHLAWANISSIALNYLSLTQVSPVMASHSALSYLELRGNAISNISLEFQRQLSHQIKQIDLTANALHEGPWLVVQSSVWLNLGSNSIATVPTNFDTNLLASRNVVLDDTPYCATTAGVGCRPKCARLCDDYMIGNLRCDWTCYSEACQFDGGDCNAFGFS